jgi:hypothetical protein
MTIYVPPGSLIAPINAGQFVSDPPPNATPAPGSFGSLGAITGTTGGAPFPTGVQSLERN